MISTQKTQDHKSEPSLFEMIYQAAKEKNKEKLTQALLLGCINIHDEKNKHTSITKLAAEGDVASVHFLITENTLGMMDAILGFAQGGYIKDAYDFLEKTKNKYFFHTALGAMARGLALGGYVTEAYQFLEEVKKKYPAQVTAVLGQMALGFSKSGYKKIADALLEKVKKEYSDQIYWILKNMVSGFIDGGNKEEAKNYLEKIKKEYPLKLSHISNEMIFVLAQNGYVTEAYAILEMKEDNVPLRDNQLLFQMAAGFTWGEYKKENDELLEMVKKQYPDKIHLILRAIASYLAIGGHKIKVYEFIAKVRNEYSSHMNAVLGDVAFSFIYGGVSEEAYAILAKAKNKDNIVHIENVLRRIVSGFVVNEDKEGLYDFLKKVELEYPSHIPNILDNIARELSHKDRYSFLEKVKKEYQKYPDRINSVLKAVAEGEKKNNSCIDKRTVLKVLMTMENTKRSTLAGELKPLITYDLFALVEQAKIFDDLMKTPPRLTYNQLCGWIQPETQIFLLQGVALVDEGKLCVSTFLTIATFLSPMTLPEMRDFSNKFATQKCPQRFFDRLRDKGVLVLTGKPKEEKQVVSLKI
jgi:hypothetical protein